MTYTKITRAVLKYLEPFNFGAIDQWQIIYDSKGLNCVCNYNLLRDDNIKIVFSFKREQIFSYYLTKAKIHFSNKKYRVRYVYYDSNGLLSAIYESGNRCIYQALSKINLHKRRNIIVRLLYRYLPTYIVDIKYIVLQSHDTIKEITEIEYDILLMSNVDGKVLLIKSDTILSGYGFVLKTTANQEYVKVLKNEYNTMRILTENNLKNNCLPAVGSDYEVENTYFYSESYVDGRSLIEIIHNYAIEGAIEDTCKVIDRLREWYFKYMNTFNVPLIKCKDLVLPNLVKFRELYGNIEPFGKIADEVCNSLCDIDRWHPGLVPVISHNDLWPANFIIKSNEFIAIDWERATHSQSGIYDYFWMMISTAIVYLKETYKLDNYSVGFRKLVQDDDIVVRHVNNALREYIYKLGFAQHNIRLFMLIFLIEWSIQGSLYSGHQNDMDRLALEELRYYYDTTNKSGEYDG